MNGRQDFQARAFKLACKNGTTTLRDPSVYPEVPAMWPNRATRRAIKHGREDRLSGAWRQRLVATPELRKAIKELH